jgi:hypothetical protein
MPFCSACGQSNRDDARFCEKCGAGMPAATASAPIAQPMPGSALPPGPGAVPPATPGVPGAGAGAGQAWATLRARYGSTPVIVVGAVAALIVGLLAWNLFLKPMDASEYVTKASSYTQDLQSATDSMGSALSDFANAGNQQDSIDPIDVKDLQDTNREEMAAFNKAAAGIRGLRPPSEYDTTQARLVTWLDYMSNTYLPGRASLINDAGSAGTYGDFQTRYQNVTTAEQSPAASSAWSAFSKASNKLGINNSGD